MSLEADSEVGPADSDSGFSQADRFPEGLRAGIPYAAASLLLAISFGVLAEPVMGTVRRS